MELKIDKHKIEHVKMKMRYGGLFVVHRVNNKGHIDLISKEQDMAKLLAYSNNFVDVSVSIQGMANWGLT